MNESYKAAGVDVEAGYESVRLIKSAVERTHIPGVLGGIGGFGGLFDLNLSGEYKHPILVSGTDGVGTKLKLAFVMDKHDTIGQDCVAMCVNDIICSGAKPLFFLDYLAVGKNSPERVAEIVGGVAGACELAGCALVGGETAEMPGFYPVDEYDLAGFAVGVVEKEAMLSPQNVKAGQTLIALKSSGVHSNGFSLIRRIFAVNEENAAKRLSEHSEELGCSIGEALLKPTRIYVKEMLPLIEKGLATSISHITGGGFYENLPRMLPQGLTSKIDKSAIQIHPIFDIVQRYSDISEDEMFGVFNMGVGMIFATDKPELALEMLEDAYVVGEVVNGREGVIIE